jgi:hypothetical protein
LAPHGEPRTHGVAPDLGDPHPKAEARTQMRRATAPMASPRSQWSSSPTRHRLPRDVAHHHLVLCSTVIHTLRPNPICGRARGRRSGSLHWRRGGAGSRHTPRWRAPARRVRSRRVGDAHHPGGEAIRSVSWPTNQLPQRPQHRAPAVRRVPCCRDVLMARLEDGARQRCPVVRAAAHAVVGV